MNVHELPSSQVIESPVRDFEPRTHQLFLMGGITNCPDWQRDIIADIQDITDITILNPRRSIYPMDDPTAALEQITWEYDQLKNATEIAIWFSRGSLNPIVLYELGIWVNARPHIPAFLGIDPAYERTSDVITQTKLARPELEPIFSLKGLSQAIRAHLLRTK